MKIDLPAVPLLGVQVTQRYTDTSGFVAAQFTIAKLRRYHTHTHTHGRGGLLSAIKKNKIISVAENGCNWTDL